MAITPEQARAELARRELARRQQQPEDNENLLQKIVHYGIKDPAIGVLNMGREFANLPNKVSGGYIPELSPSEFDFGQALGVENPESADKLIQFAGQYAPSLAIPGVGLGRAGQALGKIPGAGRFISKAVSESIPQAAYSAAQAPQHQIKAAGETAATMAPLSMLSELMNSPSKKVRAIAKTAAIGLSGLLGREAAQGLGFGEAGSDVAAVLAGALGGRHFTNKNDTMRKLTEGLYPPIAEERLKAAEKLGLDYLTPAEATVNPWIAKRQGQLGKTEEGGKMLYEKGRQRQDSERRAIEHTLNQIYSPGLMDEKVKEAYKGLSEVNLPQEFPLQYKNNAIINEAKSMVENTPAYKESLKEMLPKNAELKEGQTDVQPTSLVYWDHVKRAMDDMISKAERAGNNNEARIMSETRAKMRDQMDAAYPEYAEARALYERKMVRKGLEKVFDQKEVNGTNFYRALASEKKFEDLMGHLKNAPEAQENLKAMRLLFKDLMPPPTIKTAKGTEERGMNQSRSTGAFLESLMDSIFTGGKHDKEAVAFITSKDWLKQMEEINKIPDKQMKMAAIAMALSKGVSQGVGQQERKPLELELVGGHR
jgi:hypothetical protein